MTIKFKNRAKQFLGRGQMTKITIKLYFFFFLLFSFFPYLGGTMAHLGPPSLRHWILATSQKKKGLCYCISFHTAQDVQICAVRKEI
jgi:hypothetical protein